MTSNILPLVPSPYDPHAYDPTVAFDYHIQMALRMAGEASIGCMTVVDYPDDEALQSYSNVGDDDLCDEAVNLFMAALYGE